MEIDHSSNPISDSRTNPAAPLGKGDTSALTKNLAPAYSFTSSLSSLSESPAKNPFQDDPDESCKALTSSDSLTKLEKDEWLSVDDEARKLATNLPKRNKDNNNCVAEHTNELRNSSTNNTDLPTLDKDTQIAIENGRNSISSNSIFYYDPPNHDMPTSTLLPPPSGSRPDLGAPSGPAMHSPPTQVMERPSDAAKYRIPSSVFARASTANPVEWSTASNESLFSIHMGNMSFTREHLFMLGKSEEFGLKTDELSMLKSGDLGTFKSEELGYNGDPSVSNQVMNPPPGSQITDVGGEDASTEQGLCTGETGGGTLIKEASKANEDHSGELSSNAQLPTHSASLSLHSSRSGDSINSFAFPILTGDGSKNDSVKQHHSQKRYNHSQQQQTRSKQQPKPQPQAIKEKPKVHKTIWLSCFSCCSLCS